MKQFIGVLVLGLSLNAVAQAGDYEGWDPTRPSVVTLPEPSALPELLLCVTGLGLVALRARKTVSSK
jgi:hypothetical protein